MPTPEATGVEATTKPVFLKNRDVPQVEGKPLSHSDVYTAISKQLGSAKNLKGIQKIGGLWRIYLDDRVARIALITSGLGVRGALAPVYDTNPYLKNNDTSTTTRVTVKDIPLSVNDETIVNELEKLKIKVKSKVQRMKLRVNGFLTECYNGDRAVYTEKLNKPLPRTVQMGSFTARVYHEGQNSGPILCSKCLAQGHHASTCTGPVIAENVISQDIKVMNAATQTKRLTNKICNRRKGAHGRHTQQQ